MAILGNMLATMTGRNYPRGNPARIPSYSGSLGAYGRGYGSVSDLPAQPRGLDFGVDENTATTVTAVYRAVQLIASTIAALPLHVYEQQDGDRVRVERAADSMLWGRPNEEVSAVVFWETVIGHEVMSGNAYLYVETNPDGTPRQLWPLEPRRVQVTRDEQGLKYYVVDGSEVYRDFVFGGEIIHVTGFGRDGLTGISPIKQMALALGLTKTAEEYAARFFSQGTTLSGVLSTDQSLAEDDARSLSSRWERSKGGMSNVHKTAVLSSGLKWTPTSISPEDSQLLTLREFQVAEVARMFGIPADMLGAQDKQSSWGAGMEIKNRQFMQYTLAAHMIRFEQTLSDELLMGARYIKWNVDGLLRGTPTERTAIYVQMRNMGVYSVNDILALEERAGIGPEGDSRLVPLNMVPTSQAPAAAAAPTASG